MATKDSNDTYLAKPSGECCLKGHIHTGQPRGRFVTIAEVETYIVNPPEGKDNGNIVLYFADVYGMFTNGLLIMDGFADGGYTVFGLDYFRGDSVGKYRRNGVSDPGFDMTAWIDKQTPFADAAVPKWVEAVKAEYGKPETKFACTGYCFGAPYVCNELAGNTVTAGAFAHPAFLKDHHFENLKKPLFLSCSQIDHTFLTEARNKAVDIMNAGEKTYEVQLFSGVAHGFALRGNMDNPYERYTKEQSLRGIIKWFDFWLGQ